MTVATKTEALTALRNVGNVCTLVVKREEVSDKQQGTGNEPLSLLRQTAIRNSFRRSFKVCAVI